MATALFSKQCYIIVKVVQRRVRSGVGRGGEFGRWGASGGSIERRVSGIAWLRGGKAWGGDSEIRLYCELRARGSLESCTRSVVGVLASAIMPGDEHAPSRKVLRY